jgi:hypothetical protein
MRNLFSSVTEDGECKWSIARTLVAWVAFCWILTELAKNPPTW